jgi:hypothetical protein
MVEAVPMRSRPDDEIASGIEQALFKYEVARRRSSVVISAAKGEDGELVLAVERGAEKLREALNHPRPIKADLVLRFAAVPAERAPLSKAG